jgi:hypothetical protein
LDIDSIIEDEVLSLSGRIRNRVYKNEIFNYLKNNLQKVKINDKKYEI